MKKSASLAERVVTGRVLVDCQGDLIVTLRARVAELERTVAGLRRELASVGLPEITQAWE